MRSAIVLFIIFYIVWALLNWMPDWQHLLIGLFISGFVVFLTADLFPKRVKRLFDPRRYLWALYYIPLFLWEWVRGTLDVIYIIIHPDIPIAPGIVRIKTALKSDMALTFLANSITLAPGTMCVDIDRDNGILYIHWINVKDRDREAATRMIAGRFEKILKRIFE